MSSLVELKLRKASKTYFEGENLSGIVVIQSKGDLSHQGITLVVEGTVALQHSPKSVGMFEAFYNSLKPIQLLYCDMELAKSGKIPSGKIEIPFEVPLKAKAGKTLYESYHGVYVNIQYWVRVDMKRSLLNKDVQKQLEFMVEYKPTKSGEESTKQKALTFSITPETLQNVKEKHNVPKFRVRGCLDSTNCSITKPFSGELIVESCDRAIKSVELQLVRVETCGCAEQFARDATEIQNIQIADGDVCKGLSIPIFMIFPRLFTCPTLATNNFKIEFEVNIVVVFDDDHLVTENFPIKLLRCPE